VKPIGRVDQASELYLRPVLHVLQRHMNRLRVFTRSKFFPELVALLVTALVSLIEPPRTFSTAMILTGGAIFVFRVGRLALIQRYPYQIELFGLFLFALILLGIEMVVPMTSPPAAIHDIFRTAASYFMFLFLTQGLLRQKSAAVQ